MARNCITFFLVLSLSSFVWISIAQGQVQPIAAEDIGELIQQLGGSKYAERQEASHRLWLGGREAEPLIQKALANAKDPEIRLRCKKILAKFRLGIYPDTPPEIAALLEAFDDGDVEFKSRVIKDLRGKREYRQAIAMVELVKDEEIREQLGLELVVRIRKVAVSVIASESFDVAGDLLAWTTKYDSDGTAVRDYAYFLSNREQSDEFLAKFESKELPDNPNNSLIAGSLHALDGEFEKARELFESAEDSPAKNKLLHDINLRERNWQALADESRDSEEVWIVKQGLQAAYHRLAGDPKLHEQAMEELQLVLKRGEKGKAGERESRDEIIARRRKIESDARKIVVGLMVNRDFDSAVELNLRYSPPQAFEFLCSQSRFEEAFKQIQFTDLEGGAAKWFKDKVSEKLPNWPDKREYTFQIANLLAPQLAKLGEKEQARDLILEIRQHTETDDIKRTRMLLKACLESGFEEIAFEIASDGFGKRTHRERKDILSVFTPGRGGLTGDLLLSLRPGETTLIKKPVKPVKPDEDQGLVQQIAALASPPEGQLGDLEQLDSVAKKMEKRIKLDSKDETHAILYQNIGNMYRWNGQFSRAIKYYRRAKKVGKYERLIWFKLGDSYAKELDWPRAAIAYGEAVQATHIPDHIGFVAVAMYLEGNAMVESGNVAEGERRKAAAELLPLTDGADRYNLADRLRQRGFEEASKKMYLLGSSTTLADVDSFDSYRLNQLSSIQLEHEDPEQAAILRERSLLHLLGKSASFDEQEKQWRNYPYRQRYAGEYDSCLLQASFIHLERGKGFEAKGQFEEAAKEFGLLSKLLPMDAKPTIKWVNALDELDRKADADEVFAAAIERLANLVDKFPNAAFYHNTIAWTATQCEREPELALKHAKIAVKLEPKSGPFVDTLALSHFQNGNFEEAVKFAEAAVELQPQDEDFQKRLKQFRESFDESAIDTDGTNSQPTE